MTPLAPYITAFLRERLPVERSASQHTCDTTRTRSGYCSSLLPHILVRLRRNFTWSKSMHLW